jgi:hypothetical protein
MMYTRPVQVLYSTYMCTLLHTSHMYNPRRQKKRCTLVYSSIQGTTVYTQYTSVVQYSVNQLQVVQYMQSCTRTVLHRSPTPSHRNILSKKAWKVRNRVVLRFMVLL